MKRFKGTKGKWIISDINLIDIYSENDCDIAQCFDGSTKPITEMDMDIAEANARLISTAPEMLELLIDLAKSKGIDELINHYPELPERISAVTKKALVNES